MLFGDYGKQLGLLRKKKKDYHGQWKNINGGGRALWLLNPWPNGLY